MDVLVRLLHHHFSLIIDLGHANKGIYNCVKFQNGGRVKILAERERRIYNVSVNIRTCFLNITTLVV